MAFEQKIWYNKDENGNVPEGAPCLDADNLNRIEQGIADNEKTAEKNKGEILEYINSYVRACDLTKKITTLNTNGAIWTATEDCWLSLSVSYYHYSSSVTVKVNDVIVFSVNNNYESDYSCGNRFTPFFVKKGSVVSLSMTYYATSNQNMSATLTVYGCY